MVSVPTETVNASAHLQARFEHVRPANWNRLIDPNRIQGTLLHNAADAASNFPDLTETCTVSVYRSPCSGASAMAPPPPFTVTRQANGAVTMSLIDYGYVALLANQKNALGGLAHPLAEPGTHPYSGADRAHFSLGD